MRGCVEGIDGLLAIIKLPSLKEYRNYPGAYFSAGHYVTYGLNCQGVCDNNS